MTLGVIVRWRNKRPQAPPEGYELWTGLDWVPITDAEFESYKKLRLPIHYNPKWA